jgi:hypothetical protein
MFNTKNSKQGMQFAGSSLQEAVDNVYNVMLESNGAIVTKVSRYYDYLQETMTKNGNVYDDSVKTILTESAKDVTAQLITDLDASLDAFQQVKASVKQDLGQIVRDNTDVVQKYQPLLKQLSNATKSSFTIPKYSTDKLDTVGMLTQLTTCIKTIIGLDPKIINGPVETLEQVSDNYNKNPEESMATIKRSILGVPKTILVTDNFYELARNMLVDPKATETKYFNDDVFNSLLGIGFDIQVNEVDAVIAELNNEIVELRELKKTLLNPGDEYTSSVISKFFIVRKMAICYGLSLIVEVIQLKCRVIEEKSVNYRKIVINTYESLISPNGNQITEAYVPSNDVDIELFHEECSVERSLF